MLGAIERATRQKIEQLALPSTETVNNRRIAGFKQKITDTLAAGDLDFMLRLVEQYQQEHDVPALEVAAALAKLAVGEQPLLLKADEPAHAPSESEAGTRRTKRGARSQREAVSAPGASERFRIEVGRAHGVQPGNIVGAIANEAGLDGRHIGHIEIDDEFSHVDLPVGMPREVFEDLKKVWVCGRQLAISRAGRAKPPKSRAVKKGKPARGPAQKKRR